MTFLQQIISTIIGSVFGFLFSIALFYFTEKWKNNRKNEDLSSNLQKEINYNINFLENYKEEFDKLLRKLEANNKQSFMIFKFGKFQRLFIQEAFNKGLLYKYLTTDEINALDSMLNFFTDRTDIIHINDWEKYLKDMETQQNSLQRFEYSNDQIEKYLRLIKVFKEKLKKLR